MKEQIENLHKSYELSSKQVEYAVNPLEVAALFEKQSLSYVLIGGHMMSYYTGTPRATVDVDFIIRKADFKKAFDSVSHAFSEFKSNDKVYHVTFDVIESETVDPERIDLIKDGFPIFREVVKNYSVIVQSDKNVVRIPTLEAAIALKFAASISPNRADEDKQIDNADMTRLIKTSQHIDDGKLLKLGELIYSGGGKELTSIVKDIIEGKSVSL